MERFSMGNSKYPEKPLSDAETIKRMTGEKIAEKTGSPEVMRRYLYTFSFASPDRPKNSDFEDSRDFFIVADSSEKALEWGKRLSDAYIDSLRKETEDLNIARGLDWVTTEEELRKEKNPVHDPDVLVVQYGEDINLYALLEARHREFMRKKYGEERQK